MKSEIAEKWAQALESGEYRQCKGTLWNGSAYCCLGVLTDLYCKEKSIPFSACGLTNYMVSHVSKEVQEWAGLSDGFIEMTALPRDKKALVHAATLNDRFKYSFQEIAQCVRQTFLEGKNESRD